MKKCRGVLKSCLIFPFLSWGVCFYLSCLTCPLLSWDVYMHYRHSFVFYLRVFGFILFIFPLLPWDAGTDACATYPLSETYITASTNFLNPKQLQTCNWSCPVHPNHHIMCCRTFHIWSEHTSEIWLINSTMQLAILKVTHYWFFIMVSSHFGHLLPNFVKL